MMLVLAAGALPAHGQTTIFFETFESDFPNTWFVGGSSSPTTWGDNSLLADTGNWSGFCADNGSNSAAGYPDSFQSFMEKRDISLFVERAMYLTKGGQTFAAGHESAGVTAPALTWFLPEGATGDLFDEFILLANPNPTAATATVTYLLEDGRTFSRTMTVPATSRQNIWVDFDTPDGTTGFPLASVALSTKVDVTNGVPIIVERAMWWPGNVTTWSEAHNSPGATATGTLWGVAEGQVQRSSNTTTYLLVANTSPTPATVRVTLLREGAAPLTKQFGVAPTSRTTIDVGFEFPDAVEQRFGAMVESLGESPAQIAVECAMYNDALGVHWAAGSNQLATRLR